MTQSLIPVILAGGKGERFWPLSRKHRPKQFLSLDGSGISLLQSTAERLLPLAHTWDNLWVITSALIADGIKQQLPQLPEHNCLIEPQGKDTAPAVAWATLEVTKQHGKDAILGFFPADHCIGNQGAYQETLEAAAKIAAQEDAIVTLGITPDYPSTGYGYIEQGELLEKVGELGIYKVTRFTEKPDVTTAESFLKTGKFSWNSGMFIFRAEVVLNELTKYAPEMLTLLKEKGQEAYATLDKISIDYALMEKTQLATVIPADFGWDDLGDWNALERLQAEKQENVELGRHVNLDTKGAIVYNDNEDEVIVTIGLEDVVIVREGKATLVVNKNRTQDIKKVLKLLQADSSLETFL
ncbi:MAG: mannose-1-phosphate guanylyltransferase [Microcystaceae cyanobacterium]